MAWRIQSTVQSTKDIDVSYDLYFTTLQSHLELWLGIIGASLPTLAPIASKLIVPAFSKLVSSHRKLTPPGRHHETASRTIGGGGGGVEVPLQKTGFSRLEGESLVGLGEIAHWGNAESTKREEDSTTGRYEDVWNDPPDAITVRHEYDVVAEPRQQV